MSIDQPHDALFKAVFGRTAAAKELFSAFLPTALAAAIDFSTLRLESANPVGDRLGQRLADLLFSAEVRGEPVLLHLLLEHTSSPDSLTILDLFTSTGIILNDWARRHAGAKRVPFVLPIVVYHGPSPFSAPTDLRELFLGDAAFRERFEAWMPGFPVLLIDLGITTEEQLHRIREADHVAGCGLWLLKWSRRSGFQDRVLAEAFWMGDVVEGHSGERVARPLLRYTLAFLEPKTEPRAFAQELVERFGRKAETMARNLLEQLLEEGRKEGLVEGRAEGKAEGRTEGRVATLRHDVVRVLESRFGDLGQSGRATLDRLDSIAALDRLFDAALRAASLAEFEVEIERITRAR